MSLWVPILGAFTGYTIFSYGIVLLKGWDITIKQWVNPLTPYQFPSGNVPTVKAGQVWPGTA